MQGRKDITDQKLMSYCLSAHIPRHNLYYRLKQVLRLEYLYALTRHYYGRCGQKSIDPVVFFKLCLIKHLENIDSDRKLLEVCSLRLDLLYFLDYNIDEPLPWHSAMCRTRRLFPKPLFEQVFTYILNLCVEAGMVAGHTQAIDSALIKANASMSSLELKVPQELLEQSLEKVRVFSRVDRKAKQNKASDQQRVITADAQALKEIKSRNKRWAREQDALPGAKNKRSKYTSNKTHYSPVDPDARIAVKPGKPRQLCYLQQLCVDTAHHVICYTQADLADKKDSRCLPGVVTALLQRLAGMKMCCEAIAADAGYSSGENYHLLEANHVFAYIPPHGTFQGGPAGFTYYKEEDYWLCPNAKKVTFRKITITKEGNKKRKYFTRRSDCKACPFKQSCIGKGHEKKIEITYYLAEYERAIARLNTSQGKAMKKLRQSTVEPVLGTLINYMGLRRINTRGIAQAEKTMLMASCAYNLRKWLYFTANKRKTAAMALVKAASQAVLDVFWAVKHQKTNYATRWLNRCSNVLV